MSQPDLLAGHGVGVKVSAAMMRQLFHPCAPDFVRGGCGGRCCDAVGGAKVAIAASETDRFVSMGAAVTHGMLEPDQRGMCPFKSDDGLCTIHDHKPMGCRFSPFTLTSRDTLVVRHRYRFLPCYGCDGSVPAYRAHGWSLAQLFGDAEAIRITAHLDDGGGDVWAIMPRAHHEILTANNRKYRRLRRRKKRRTL